MRRFGLAGLALVVVIVLAGCSAGPIAAPANETATPTTTVPQAIQNATADTYRFSYNATLTNSAGPLNVTAKGVVDRTDRRLNVTYEYGDPIDRTVTIVTIGNQTYQRENGTWTEYTPPDDATAVAWNGTMLARQRALWNASNVSRANVSGPNASISNVSVSNASRATRSESNGSKTNTSAPNASTSGVVTLTVSNRSVVENMLKSEPFTLPKSVYVRNATYRISRRPDGPVTRVDLEATIVQSNTEGTIEAHLTFSDHGDPVTITPPPIASETS